MAQRHRTFLPALLLLGAAGAAVAWSVAGLDHRRSAPERALPARPEPGVCVTPAGICNAPWVPTGDPCGCPTLLHGTVPGHVERLSVPAGERHPPGGDARDEDQWGRLAGP